MRRRPFPRAAKPSKRIGGVVMAAGPRLDAVAPDGPRLRSRPRNSRRS